MNGLQKKCEKPAFLAKKGNFGQILAKMVKTGTFFKKALTSPNKLQSFRKK